MNNIEYDIVGFKNSKCNFEIECGKYIDHMGSLKEKEGRTVICLIDGYEPANSMRLAISHAVPLLEKVNLDMNDGKFISGIRYINNIFKHKKEYVFEINEISRAGFKIAVKVNDQNGLEIEDVKITPILTFGEMDLVDNDSNLTENMKCQLEVQRRNYVQYIKSKDTIVILKRLESILSKYYDLNL